MVCFWSSFMLEFVFHITHLSCFETNSWIIYDIISYTSTCTVNCSGHRSLHVSPYFSNKHNRNWKIKLLCLNAYFNKRRRRSLHHGACNTFYFNSYRRMLLPQASGFEMAQYEKNIAARKYLRDRPEELSSFSA